VLLQPVESAEKGEYTKYVVGICCMLFDVNKLVYCAVILPLQKNLAEQASAASFISVIFPLKKKPSGASKRSYDRQLYK